MLRTLLTLTVGLILSAGTFAVYADDQVTDETNQSTQPDNQFKEKVSAGKASLNDPEESCLETLGTVKKLAKMYDPNTDVIGDEIAAKDLKISSADPATETFGPGRIFHRDDNMKIAAYSDIPTNESTGNLKNSKPYKDYPRNISNNLFTLLLQCSFRRKPFNYIP